MYVNNIPNSQIITKTAASNKDYELDFINTDSNNDVYTLKIYLRRNDEQYKIRLVLISSILAYPALDMSWEFDKEDFELASRVFHRICDEVDSVKTDYDRSMMPVSAVAAKIKEYVKPISVNHQEKTNIPSIDESTKEAGVSDWRMSLYSGHYPHMTKKEKNEFHKFEGNQIVEIPNTKTIPSREKY